MSLPEIQMLWVNGTLSKLERLSIASYLDNGHPVRLFSYEPIPDLPEGAIPEDARTILPESAVFTNPSPDGYGGLAMFSNFFRYQLLLQRGGVWSDCDLVCIKPLTFASDMEYFFASERKPTEQNAASVFQITNCVFKAPAGSSVIARTLEIAQAVDRPTAPWGSTGPRALHQAVAELDLNRFVLAPEVINPITWWQISTLVTGLEFLPANAHTVHFYNEMWRRNFLDKNADYDPLSLFERLKSHYLRPRGGAHG